LGICSEQIGRKYLNADKHSTASGAQSTKRWISYNSASGEVEKTGIFLMLQIRYFDRKAWYFF